MLTITLLITAHHYTTQKNMIRQMIKQHFISQQQTQMQSFFASAPEPIVVVASAEGESTKEPQIYLQNECAERELGSVIRISDSDESQNIQTNQINLKADMFYIRSKGLDKIHNHSVNTNSVDSEPPETSNPKKLFSILDMLERDNAEDTLVNIVNLEGGAVHNRKLWSLTWRNMIFKSKQCKILVLRDMSMIRENVRLANSNKMMSLV